jgi:cell division initiation protein
MKITPLEIRQKTFEKNLRGYDKDEVAAFLVTLSQEWEKIQDDYREAKLRLESSEREVGKLREVETSLFKTLKTAEDTGNNLIEQANKAAELQLRESQLQAEGLLYEARAKAKEIVEEAETRSQQILDGIESRLKDLVQEYRGMLIHKDNFSADLIRLAAELTDRAERLKKAGDGFHPDQYHTKAKKEISPAETTRQEPTTINKPVPVQEPFKKATGSFFDEIG